MNRKEWMIPDQAARYLNCTSTKAFQEIVVKEGVPRRIASFTKRITILELS